MELTTARMLVWCLKLYILALFSPLIENARALDEIFEVYHAPQALGMGNAFTADAHGYTCLYYNPACLAKQTKKNVEVTIVDLQGIGGFNAISQALSAQSTGMYRLFGKLESDPGTYHYLQFSAAPGVVWRGIGFSLLGSYRNAALSDGTNIDLNSVTDFQPTIGFGHNFAGNLLRLGVAFKALARNQLKGEYAHSELATHNDSTFPTLFKEGLAIGADIGGQLVFPNKMLPTIAFAWKDITDTKFSSSKLLNPSANGTPDNIKQSVNAAFSLHPYFTNRLRGTIAAEMRHIELTGLPLRKRLHFGVQLEDEKSLYFWFGLNQLYLTAGVGYRVSGGSLELGTYGQDIGEGEIAKEDRRIFFRYTIGF